MKIPAKLYHGTTPEALDAIQQEGILPSWDGCVYLSDKKDQAFTFTYRHHANKVEVTTAREHYHGRPIPRGIDPEDFMPRIERRSHLYIVEVDARVLEAANFDVGRDHDPRFFGKGNVLTYRGQIPAHAINRVHRYQLNQ